MVVRMHLQHRDYRKDKDLFPEQVSVVSRENARRTVVTTQEPSSWGANAWPEVVIKSVDLKETADVKSLRFGTNLRANQVETEIAGQTVPELMDALLETPETFSYLAMAVDYIREHKQLANGESAEEHIAVLSRNMRR